MGNKKWVRKIEENLGNIVEEIYKKGYKEGYDSAVQKHNGCAGFTKASIGDIARYGEELAGWCSDCYRPIEGKWVENISFCPWCGKKFSLRGEWR